MSKPPTETCKHAVPYSCTESREQGEHAYVHAGKPGRDAYELAHSRNQAADKSGHSAMLVEVFLGVLHFFSVEKTGMADTRIGEPIDKRTAYPQSQQIIDKSSGHRSGRGGKNDSCHIHLMARLRRTNLQPLLKKFSGQ